VLAANVSIQPGKPVALKEESVKTLVSASISINRDFSLSATFITYAEFGHARPVALLKRVSVFAATTLLFRGTSTSCDCGLRAQPATAMVLARKAR